MRVEVSRQNRADAMSCILKAAADSYATEEIWNGSALVIAAFFAIKGNSLEDLDLGPILQVLTDTNSPTERIEYSLKWIKTG